MNFLLDENFPKSAVEVLEKLGHQCHSCRETLEEGADDAKVVEEAINREAVLLTTDRDFFHTLRHQFPHHRGVMVIALKQPNRAAIIDRLLWLLERINDADLPGRAFQLRDNTWAAQPPLEKPLAESDSSTPGN